MGQKFCTICGSVLTEGVKFCENCGAAVEQTSPASTPSSVSPPPLQNSASPSGPLPKGNPMMKIIVGIVVILVVLAGGVYFFVLPKMSGSGIPSPKPEGNSFSTVSPTPTTVIVTTPTPEITTTVPTPPPDPFPDAFPLRKIFSYNEGKYASKATVYRYWMNDTYQWHSDADNRFYTQKPTAGNKYLLIFVNIENIGTDGYPYPKAGSIAVHNGGNVYQVDTSHYLPDKAGNKKASAIEIQELEQQSDFFNMERVEDYGYSHGTTQDFVFPGQGNAIDGYLIYEVPTSLTPENTYVEIVFDGQDRNVWKLG